MRRTTRLLLEGVLATRRDHDEVIGDLEELRAEAYASGSRAAVWGYRGEVARTGGRLLAGGLVANPVTRLLPALVGVAALVGAHGFLVTYAQVVTGPLAGPEPGPWVSWALLASAVYSGVLAAAVARSAPLVSVVWLAAIVAVLELWFRPLTVQWSFETPAGTTSLLAAAGGVLAHVALGSARARTLQGWVSRATVAASLALMAGSVAGASLLMHTVLLPSFGGLSGGGLTLMAGSAAAAAVAAILVGIWQRSKRDNDATPLAWSAPLRGGGRRSARGL